MIKLKNLINEALTDQQDWGIKKLYIMLRDIYMDLVQKSQQNNVNRENWKTSFWPFFQKVYQPPPGVVKKVNKMVIQLPEDLRAIFPDLAKTMDLRFQMEGGATMIEGGSSLALNIEVLLFDTHTLKSYLQHEMQHLVDIGREYNNDQENKLLVNIEYFGDEGEISAYAKQNAYFYYKVFPEDRELDLEKFKRDVLPKLNSVAQNARIYFRFGEETKELQLKWKVDDEVAKRMVQIYNTFINSLKAYYQRFIRK